MRMLVGIALAVLLITVSICDFLTVLAFEINRDQIAEKYCINLDAPEGLCNGQCFLNTVLEKQAEQEEKLPALKMHDQTLFVINQSSTSYTYYSFPSIIISTRVDDHLDLNLAYDIFHPPQVWAYGS